MKAMSKPIQLGDGASLESVDAAYKASQECHDRERLLAMRLAHQGNQTLAQIGVILKRVRATIARWVKAYREGGIQKLLHRGHGGRKASLCHSDQEGMIEELYSGCWKRAKDIQIWLQEELKLGGVYYWLYKLKSSWKVPRPKHKDQDPDEVAAFRKEIVSRLEALDVPEDQAVHVWVEDEHRYGLISVLRRCWTIKGHRVTVPRQMKYEWSYVYAAADIVTGNAEFLHTPTVSTQWSQVFLEQLIATDPEGIHIIIWDRAGYHPTVLTNELAESLRFLPLPAYSPELNPIEPLWDQVKRRVANDIWGTLDSMGYAIDEVLEPFWKHVTPVWSLLGNTWLTRGVIIFLQHRLE
jgi:transposase